MKTEQHLFHAGERCGGEVDLQGRQRSGGEEDREAGMKAGAVTDDWECRHTLAEGDGVEPHERRAWQRPGYRRLAQPFRPTRRVLQSSQPAPQEHRRRRDAARRPVQLVQRPPSAGRRCRRMGRSHGWRLLGASPVQRKR